ncbi:MAG: LuxR C-terminal-related transcriptional regulator, partial [Thermodesulfobacteriota bacterium]|nr:LuxR C-terminal-related transcriptional regulator [Thermodesulfobacteriota bacterium]
MMKLIDKTICVAGPRKTQNELMALFLEQTMGAKCQVGEDGWKIPVEMAGKGKLQRLILWDCDGKDLEVGLTAFELRSRKLTSQDLVAFFNLGCGREFEEKALAKGVWGFFYEQDPLEQFPKGINAIFNGEFWASRQTMTKCILQNKGISLTPSEKVKEYLTEREIMVLSLISIGASNDKIARELSISRHTVKTHIYN